MQLFCTLESYSLIDNKFCVGLVYWTHKRVWYLEVNVFLHFITGDRNRFTTIDWLLKRVFVFTNCNNAQWPIMYFRIEICQTRGLAVVLIRTWFSCCLQLFKLSIPNKIVWGFEAKKTPFNTIFNIFKLLTSSSLQTLHTNNYEKKRRKLLFRFLTYLSEDAQIRRTIDIYCRTEFTLESLRWR